MRKCTGEIQHSGDDDPAEQMTNSPAVMIGLQILQGLLTPVIAVVAVYIAWQQWKVNERKFEFDRYERRIRIYQEVRTILTRATLLGSNFEFNAMQEFRTATAEADFLFEPEISAYLDEIVERWGRLQWASSEYERSRNPQLASPNKNDSQKLVDTMMADREWFTQQHQRAKEMFRKYLYVPDRKFPLQK